MNQGPHLTTQAPEIHSDAVALPSGLSADDAKARLATGGPNRPVPEDRGRALKELLRTLSDPMALMLIGAAAIYALTAEYRNAIILGAAALPVLLADVILEAQSRSALKKLANANASRAHVIRDGREAEIASDEIVVGDLLVLREGDLVHADAIVRWSANLAIDESQLTGESEPQAKTSSSIAALQPDENSVYSGSLVVSGHGYAEVYATGPHTRFAKIAQLLATIRQAPAPLERKVARITRWLVLIAFTIAAVIFVLRFHGTGRGIESVLYAIGVAISSIPEEFPLVLTLLLSVGAYRLSRQGVLVQRLSCSRTQSSHASSILPIRWSVRSLTTATSTRLTSSGFIASGRWFATIHSIRSAGICRTYGVEWSTESRLSG
jgi:Ca2+-transporting ATPase